MLTSPVTLRTPVAVKVCGLIQRLMVHETFPKLACICGLRQSTSSVQCRTLRRLLSAARHCGYDSEDLSVNGH